MAITRVSGLNVIKDYTPTLRPGLDGYYYVLQRLDNGTLAAASNSFSATNTETLQLTVLNSIGTTHTALQTVATENAQHTLLNFDLAPGAYGSFFVDWSSDIVSGTNPLNSDSFGQAYTKDGIASQPAVNLSNAPGGGEFFASAVQLGNGRYLAVWNDTLASTQSSLDVSIVGHIYSSTGAAIGSEFVLANGSGIQFMAESLSLGDGRTLVFWGNAKIDSTGHADFTGMDGRFLDANGTPVGSVMSIDSMVSGKFYGSKDAVALGNGGFVVAWHESARLDGSADQVHFQRFNAAIVRSRNPGVISRDLSGWKRPACRARTRSNRKMTPAPPARRCISRE